MIYEIYGSDARKMTMNLMEAANIADKIPEGGTVALKPNLVVAAPPERGATTHGGVLEGAIEYLQTHNIHHIEIIEGSWVGDRTERGIRICGYDKISEKYHVPIYDLKKDQTRKIETEIGPMEVCCRALDADYLINLPVLKGHCQTRMTCALKNCKGCIPDKEKRRFHQLGLMKPIAALAAALKPDLTIVDSICGDIDFEEGGNPVYTGRMMLGEDPVQLDSYGCSLMGIDTAEVEYISLAEKWGLGTKKVDPEEIVYLNKPNEVTYTKSTGTAAKLTGNVQEKSACSACYAALVRALYETGRTDIPIAIGQDWKGKAFHGTGIGNCCALADNCVKGCPPTSEKIKQHIMRLP